MGWSRTVAECHCVAVAEVVLEHSTLLLALQVWPPIGIKLNFI